MSERAPDMAKVHIINGHQPYPFAQGRLKAAFVERARKRLAGKGYAVRVTEIAKGYVVATEVAADFARFDAHLDAQFPPVGKEVDHVAA